MMARYKVTCEVEGHCHTDEYVQDHFGKWVVPVPGTVEVERLPDPPVVQRFMVEVESPAGISVSRIRADQIEYFLMHPLTLDNRRRVSAAEVTQ